MWKRERAPKFRFVSPAVTAGNREDPRTHSLALLRSPLPRGPILRCRKTTKGVKSKESRPAATPLLLKVGQEGLAVSSGNVRLRELGAGGEKMGGSVTGLQAGTNLRAAVGNAKACRVPPGPRGDARNGFEDWKVRREPGEEANMRVCENETCR